MSPIVNVARALTARLRDAEEYVSRQRWRKPTCSRCGEALKAMDDQTAEETLARYLVEDTSPRRFDWLTTEEQDHYRAVARAAIARLS